MLDIINMRYSEKLSRSKSRVEEGVTFITMFSNSEKYDMIIVYGACDENATRAKILYGTKYPDRNQPSRFTFSRLSKMLKKNGSFNVQQRKYHKIVRDEECCTSVTAAIAHNPHVSTRQISRGAGISQSSVVRILHSQKFHPYHLSVHQELHGQDFEKRVQFCEWFLHQIQNTNGTILQTVLWTDEATFTNRGEVNLKNMHYWATENPHWLREIDHQHRWNLNVWCGIIGHQIIGPYFINGPLTGQAYSTFLSETLPDLLENVPLNVRSTMWYQHDGCPAHYARQSRQVLNRMFPNRWIGRGSNIAWPARSPDLTPLDYFLWGALKNEVYREPPTTIADMRERITTACAAITAETLEKVSRSLIIRLRNCIDCNGQHFEHCLK